MRCQVVQQKLDQYAGQSLSGPERELMERHLRSCPVCQQSLERQSRLQTLLQSCHAPPIPEEFAARVLARAESHPVVVTRPSSRGWTPGVTGKKLGEVLGMVGTLAAGLLIGLLLGHQTWQSGTRAISEFHQGEAAGAAGLGGLIDPGDDTLAQTYLQMTLPRDG
ncbi:MAG: zf-HC2 domain-containing protein [Pirellulaceae bacterium]|nr:zf-HC2 domain-containing protein [Pirellulaceae bacterium]